MDPLLGYRNNPEYQRQRWEAIAKGEDEAVEARWAAWWARELAKRMEETH